jgi:hypothetical protein
MENSTTKQIRLPEWDICADLRNAADAELGDAENVCSVSNRQLRLYVGGFMLGNPRAALELYEGCGRPLLERPGRLTTAGIASEVLGLLRPSAEDDGR